jgi:hypothetical protein
MYFGIGVFSGKFNQRELCDFAHETNSLLSRQGRIRPNEGRRRYDPITHIDTDVLRIYDRTYKLVVKRMIAW